MNTARGSVLQRFVQNKNSKMDDRRLVSSKTIQPQDDSWMNTDMNHQNSSLLSMQKGSLMNNDDFFQNSSAHFQNNTFMSQSSSVRQSVVQTNVQQRIIRKSKRTIMVNGEVVEEVEEEEDEPTFHTTSHAERIISNDVKGGMFGTSFSSGDSFGSLFKGSLGATRKIDSFHGSVGAVEGDKSGILALENGNKNDDVKDDLRRSEEARKKTVLQKLGFGKKKEEYKNIENEKIKNIVNELTTTEERYIADLATVVDNYMCEFNKYRTPLALDKEHIFGNIENIYMFHDVQFQPDLKECDNTPNGIANCFLKHKKEFCLYRHYNRNKPYTESYLQKHQEYFKERTKQLQDSQNVASHLIKPTQRIGRYILLLKEIHKECKKSKLPTTELNEAIQMLLNEVKFGNDLMALDALKGLPGNLDIKAQGDLICRDQFMVTPPDKKKKYEAMIFLFKDMIVISDVQLEDNIDKHYYKDNILLKEVGLTECHNEAKVFKIWYLQHNKKNYTLQTKPEIKKVWVTEIRRQLESELNKMKEEVNRSSVCDETKYIDLNQRKYIDVDVKRK